SAIRQITSEISYINSRSTVDKASFGSQRIQTFLWLQSTQRTAYQTNFKMKAFIVFAAILSAAVAAPQYPEFYSVAQDPRMLPMPQVPMDMAPQEPRAYEPYYAPQQYEPQYQPQYQAQPQKEQLTADGYKIVPGVVDARCPRADDPMKPVHLAVHGNCAKFMKCFGGRAYEMDCPSGLEFGAKVNRCDYPAMAQCSRF
uniref:Uncharacterized protein n=2 Tax=Anopheles atroparvus TaxID=41427 RepID=A0A182IRD7_ANOAO